MLPLQLFFKSAKHHAKESGEAWVGSAVVYGPFHEWGTSVIQARPHWRVAIAEIIGQAGGDVKMQNQVFEAVLKGEAPMEVALMLERRVKQIITSEHIIDTGNYRASIAAGKTEDEAFSRSAGRAKDPGTVA
jgi:hypothetical protein